MTAARARRAEREAREKSAAAWGSVPKAVIEVGGDASVWFYPRRACARVEQFAALPRSPKLTVRPLPRVDLGGLRPKAWRVDVRGLRQGHALPGALSSASG